MIYSRPGAWADIRVSRNDRISSANTKMIVDELTFELQYDFTQRPNSNRNLDVYAADVDGLNGSLTPFIEVSRPDKNGRNMGRVPMYRTYDRNSGSVKLVAPEEYGRYRFVNWTNSNNNVTVNTRDVTVSITNDVAYTANYKYMGAVLSVTDSIFISANAGSDRITVENDGLEEMDWTAVSNNSWLRITAGSEGTDEGDIELEYDANPLKTHRIGSVTITSEDTGESKTVYVKQYMSTVTSVEVAPATATVQKGATQQFTATVTATGGASEAVTWTVSSTTGSAINETGLLTVASGETATSLTVTATSVFDGTKKGTATVTVTVKQVTGAKELERLPFAVYPNPTDGIVTLVFETAGKHNITLSDITGKTLLRQTVSDQTVHIDLNSYHAGVYLITIDDGKRQNTTRVVKN
jgi:hypothetical protein